jgi:hypothetical protein
MIYIADGHYLRLFENPHPSPLPRGEGAKATIGTRVEYLGRAMRALTLVPKAAHSTPDRPMSRLKWEINVFAVAQLMGRP